MKRLHLNGSLREEKESPHFEVERKSMQIRSMNRGTKVGMYVVWVTNLEAASVTRAKTTWERAGGQAGLQGGARL